MSQHRSLKSQNQDELKRFFIKYTIIASSITWFIGSYLRDFLKKIVEALVDPFFSVDLNADGKPDLKQLDAYIFTIFNHKFPLGQIIIELIRTVITIIVIYVIVKVIIHYTSLVDLN